MAEKRKRLKHTISIEAEALAGLEKLAKQHNFMWGDNPNVSRLIEAIGFGVLRLEGSTDTAKLSPIQIEAILSQVRTLLEKVS